MANSDSFKDPGSPIAQSPDGLAGGAPAVAASRDSQRYDQAPRAIDSLGVAQIDKAAIISRTWVRTG